MGRNVDIIRVHTAHPVANPVKAYTLAPPRCVHVRMW